MFETLHRYTNFTSVLSSGCSIAVEVNTGWFFDFLFLCRKLELMSWKKFLPYFIWQSIRYAQNWNHFLKLWTFRERWRGSFRAGRNSVVDEVPWINMIALEFLEKALRPEFKVFEFGGGGSTLFFCKNVAEVVTVEDDANWFGVLKQLVQEKGHLNWKGYFVEPDLVNDSRPRSRENPSDFMSGSKGAENLSYERYARTIDQFPPKYFDIILVDGRARPSCIQQSLKHIKAGGFLIIDNTERSYYLTYFRDYFAKNFEVVVNDFAPVNYTPDFTKATILKKIS